MPSRLAIQKLRRHLHGLENYPMSSSYPQESGETEFREMVAAVHNTQPERKVETSVTVGEGTKSYCASVMDGLTQYLCGTRDQEEDVDQTDGRTEDILRPLVKLYFLKILFIDIGISLGDVVTDLAQGINLIFDQNWNIQWSTFHYGLVIIGLLWTPLVPLSLHIWSTREVKHFIKTDNKSQFLLTLMALTLFFPLVPTAMYVRILFIRRSFTSNRNKLKYLEFEQKATEMKSIVGSLESPLQFILMLWLMFRGILTLPWDQPLSSSCVEDSLGRVACLPSIPILSMLFSLLSIIKSVFDLNLSSVSSASLSSLTKSKVCQHLVLCFFPFYLCNILFRLPAYAFILTFIDIWSIIPGLVLYVLQLALCGLFFIRQEPEEDDVPLDNIMKDNIMKDNIMKDNIMKDNIMKGSSGTINQASTDDQGRPEQNLVWDGQHWTSNSVTGNNSLKERHTSLSNVPEVEDAARTEKSDLINDKNTPVFLNSVAGLFYPCVHTCFRYHQHHQQDHPAVGLHSLQTVQEIIEWQRKVIKYEVFIFNVGIITVLLTIFFLVTFVDAFYYKTNIFDFFWFTLAIAYLVFMGLASLVWSLWVYPDKIFPIQEKENEKSPSENDGNITRKKRRHLTGDSNNESICSATTSFIQNVEGPENMKLRSLFCVVVSALVIIPPLLGITFYKILPSQQLYLVKFDQNPDSIEVNIVGVSESSGVTTDLFGFLKSERVFLTNRTKVNLEEANDVDLIVLIDPRLEHQWRGSSPSRETFPGLSIPVLVLRKSDLSVQKLKLDGEDLFLTTNITNLETILQPFSSCTQDSVIYLNYDASHSTPSGRLKEKYFSSEDGRIFQDWDCIAACTVAGFNCQFQAPKLINVECTDFNKSIETQYINWVNKKSLTKLNIFNRAGREKNFCCLNSSHAVEIFGEQDPVGSDIINNPCIYSKIIQDTKVMFGKKFYKFCQVGDLIIKQSFQTDFENNILTNSCNVKEFPC